MLKPIAGRASDVAAYLRSKFDPTDRKEAALTLTAQELLLVHAPEQNVVVDFRYLGTKRTHVVVTPCHLVTA